MGVLHEGTDILISSTDALPNTTNLRTISIMQIPAHFIVTILTKLNSKCITATPCILEVDIDEMVSIQNLKLIMLPMVHLKNKIEPVQVQLTIINSSHNAI